MCKLDARNMGALILNFNDAEVQLQIVNLLSYSRILPTHEET